MPLTALSSIEVSFYSTRANEINRFLILTLQILIYYFVKMQHL